MAAFEYRFKMPKMHKVSADVAGKICQELSDSADGLTPKRLVDVSRSKNAPLHDEFEWDDSVAGEKYREQQAQTLIQHLVIVQTDNEAERIVKLTKQSKDSEDAEVKDYPADRGFVSTGEHNTRYVPLASALTNDLWRASLLESARKDSRIFVSKYNRLEELAEIVDDMNRFLGA